MWKISIGSQIFPIFLLNFTLINSTVEKISTILNIRDNSYSTVEKILLVHTKKTLKFTNDYRENFYSRKYKTL